MKKIIKFINKFFSILGNACFDISDGALRKTYGQKIITSKKEAIRFFDNIIIQAISNTYRLIANPQNMKTDIENYIASEIYSNIILHEADIYIYILEIIKPK